MSPSTPTNNPDVPAQYVRHKALLTLAVMGATIIQILDSTIANVAIPHMQSSLGATQDTITWVLTSYIIASAVAMPITGYLADRFGSRRLFILAVGGFIVASMLCGIANSLVAMVAFRILQGLCAAFIGPLSQTIMLDINAPSKQQKAMATYP
jgi:MFS transporter, DHA2 family, multidrug resistance protein